MLESNSRQTTPHQNSLPSASLQLLLFIDDRPSSQTHIQRIQDYLQSLRAETEFELQLINVGEQPYLAEHFKLVATPALVRIYPEPKHMLAGTDLVAQLKKWWPKWQLHLERTQAQSNELTRSPTVETSSTQVNSVNYSAEMIRLSDEVFRLEKERESLLEQLQFKDQVLAMLAHDLRSPLTAASIALETLELAQKSLDQDPERTTALKAQLYKQAKSQFRIMNRMITDILQASKGMSAQLKIQPHQLFLQGLCEDIVLQMQPRIKRKSQTLKSDIPQDLPAVYADPELLRQVMINLVENAIKYTPEEGMISLSILHRTTQKIQVSICDTGPGIPQEKQERIFEGHFRLKRDQHTEGYGIGLALCRNVIRAHYGQIWVDSTLGQGSCFRFTLPVYH